MTPKLLITTSLLIITFLIPPNASATNWLDHRFGVGGVGRLKELGVKWKYNWSWDVRNDTSIIQDLTNGHHTLVVIGTPDHNLDPCPSGTPHYSSGKPDCGLYHRIPSITKVIPGAYYAIGNEPDWAPPPYIVPAEYATWYHAFHTAIKAADPTAKVSFGGLAWPRYNHPRKWRSKELLAHPIVLQCKAGQGPVPISMCEDGAWFVIFYQTYRNKYGTPPPIDFSNIHPYPWVATIDPNAAFQDSKQSIEFAQSLFSALGYSTPMWVTEINFSYQNQTCTTLTDCNQKASTQIKYMDLIIPWMMNSNYIKKWFWFYGNNDYTGTSNTNNQAYDLFISNTTNTPNSLAQRYQYHARKKATNPYDEDGDNDTDYLDYRIALNRLKYAPNIFEYAKFIKPY